MLSVQRIDWQEDRCARRFGCLCYVAGSAFRDRRAGYVGILRLLYLAMISSYCHLLFARLSHRWIVVDFLWIS